MSLSDKLEHCQYFRYWSSSSTQMKTALSATLEQGLIVLADGMGGYKAGEVASAIAVTSSHTDILSGLKKIKPGQTDKVTGLHAESDVVKNAIINANSNIYSSAEGRS